MTIKAARLTDSELREMERKLADCYGIPSVENTDFMSASLGRLLAELRVMRTEQSQEARLAA